MGYEKTHSIHVFRLIRLLHIGAFLIYKSADIPTMKTQTENRLDPSLLTPEDREKLERLNELVQEERPVLCGREGVRIDLPDQVFHHLVRVVRAMREGKTILLMPETECFTTQAAANFLGVSRPFLVELLEQGTINHHRVGSHRRVYLKDLMEYRKNRDHERRKILDDLTETLEKEGVYDIVDSEHASQLSSRS
jgi:excisionase family DNA binding protein